MFTHHSYFDECSRVGHHYSCSSVDELQRPMRMPILYSYRLLSVPTNDENPGHLTNKKRLKELARNVQLLEKTQLDVD